MGKTYEALERAEKEARERREVVAPELFEGPPESALPGRCGPVFVGYDDLRTNLLARYPDGSIRAILFTGTAHGGGTSTTAVNFAAALARDNRLKILLIDANLRTPTLQALFKLNHVKGLSDLVSGNGGDSIKVGPGNLHVIPCGGRSSDPVTLFASNGFDLFLQRARETYDYVVLDSPPVQRFSEVRILCAKVDGVVLVIESGKVRRRVALGAKDQLEKAGGKVLGVVLTKRKYYIPEFIYRWL